MAANPHWEIKSGWPKLEPACPALCAAFHSPLETGVQQEKPGVHDWRDLREGRQAGEDG